MELLAVGISLVSLGVSALVAWSQHRSGGRAHFTAEWNTHRYVMFTNQGPGSATDVRAELVDDDNVQVVSADYMPAFQHLRVPIPPRRHGAPYADALTVTWRDNRKGRSSTLPLPLPPAIPRQRRGATDLEQTVRALASEEARREMDTAAARAMRNRRRDG